MYAWNCQNFCVRGGYSLALTGQVIVSGERLSRQARNAGRSMFLGSIKAPVPLFFNRLPLCKLFFACPRFFCSVEAPFSCPGHPSPGHRAQRRSRLGAPAPTAQRPGLDGGEHGVTLQWLAASVPAGSWFFPRSDETAATWHRGGRHLDVPNAVIRRSRNEGSEVAGPRPGWDMLPPRSGGSPFAHD